MPSACCTAVSYTHLVDIAPARVAPSPRHPLHALAEDALEPGVAPEDPYDQTFTGNQAAEIADEIGREIAQEIADEYGDDERAARAMRTKMCIRDRSRAS